ncbi:MAG: ABC transporter permease [Buchananella hordeovulneris]|nr:ABC transporter permease [Buchananella hordeovulneris]
MRNVFFYQVLRLFRDRTLLMWTLAFPLILSAIFMGMFAKLEQLNPLEPISLGVVDDVAYAAAPGLDALVTELADATSDHHFVDATRFGSEEAASAAAAAGDVQGYLVVLDESPRLYLTTLGNAANASMAVRQVLDSYVRSSAQVKAVLAAGGSQADVAALQIQHEFTTLKSLTEFPTSPTARFFFALLALTAGMGAMTAATAVKEINSASSPVGARRALAGISRWRVLVGTLGAAWLLVTASLMSAFAFMLFVARVNFGPHPGLAVVAILASSFMASAVGSLFGTFPRLQPGLLSAFSSLLSLFTGLFGDGSQKLADLVELHLPWLSAINPLWQSSHTFYSLLFYDTLTSFWHGCAILMAMAAVFGALTVWRTRRISNVSL